MGFKKIINSVLASILFVPFLLKGEVLSQDFDFDECPSLEKRIQVYEEISKKRVNLPIDNLIYSQDYTWDYKMDDLPELFDNIYFSGKRLVNPIYYNRENDSFLFLINDSELKVPYSFVYSITRHIEEALENGFADWIFAPDMGHGHFHLPKFFNKQNYSYKEIWEEIISNSKVRILYHTAEMFIFLGKKEDFEKLSEKEKFRNKTRNLEGVFDGFKPSVNYISYKDSNVVYQLNDYNNVLKSIEISASKDGQFPFCHNGKISFFDISSFSFPYKKD